LALAQMAAAVLGGLAIGLSAGQWLALPLLGPVGSLVSGALLLMAVGGLTQVFAQTPSDSARHLRLGLIFASLAAAIAVFPSDVRRWVHTQSAAPALSASSVDTRWLIRQAAPGAKRFCVIGPQTPGPHDNPALIAVSFLFPPAPGDLILDGSRRVFPNACLALRREHGVYDLIYQRGPLPAAGQRHADVSVEWLERLARHRAPGGRIVLDLTLAGLNAGSAATVACTFEQAMREPCSWRVTRTDGQAVLRLCTGNPEQPGESAVEAWRPVTQLLAGVQAVSIHSLRRDAISRTLRFPSQPEGLLVLQAAPRTADLP